MSTSFLSTKVCTLYKSSAYMGKLLPLTPIFNFASALTGSASKNNSVLLGLPCPTLSLYTLVFTLTLFWPAYSITSSKFACGFSSIYLFKFKILSSSSFTFDLNFLLFINCANPLPFKLSGVSSIKDLTAGENIPSSSLAYRSINSPSLSLSEPPLLPRLPPPIPSIVFALTVLPVIVLNVLLPYFAGKKPGIAPAYSKAEIPADIGSFSFTGDTSLRSFKLFNITSKGVRKVTPAFIVFSAYIVPPVTDKGTLVTGFIYPTICSPTGNSSKPSKPFLMSPSFAACAILLRDSTLFFSRSVITSLSLLDTSSCCLNVASASGPPKKKPSLSICFW